MSQRTDELLIGTRGSMLAVWQAEWIRTCLRKLHPGLAVSLKRIKTTGDKILDTPLATIGGKGLFVKEIEESLARGEIDLAVHSMKDVPTCLPAGMAILAVPAREDPQDVLISREGLPMNTLPHAARIGTSSLRRQSQILHFRPDLRIAMLRGNLDTRLRKLDEGAYDGIVLAAAGLRRLGLESRISEHLSAEICLPAIGQGALALEGRADDRLTRDRVVPLDDRPTRLAVSAERAFLERLEGGCQVPIAAHGTVDNRDDPKRMTLTGLVASLDGSRIVRGSIEGPVEDALRLGSDLAERLLAEGGREILEEIYDQA
jgi:hydroxymethylbilane synthase